MANIYVEEKEIRRLLSTIKPDGHYYLNDVVEQNLIPGVFSYEQAYAIVHDVEPSSENKTGKRFVMAQETTADKIHAYHEGRPGRKTNGKLFIRGEDIIVFLRLNGLIKKSWFGAKE